MADLLSSFVSVVNSWNCLSAGRQFLNFNTFPFAFNATSVCPLQVNVPVAVALAVAVAVGVAVPVANAAIQAANGPNQQLDQRQISDVVSNALTALSITAPVSISVPFVVAGLSFRTDGCGDGGIRFKDGSCYPVLKRGPCPDSQWILVDPQSLTVKD